MTNLEQVKELLIGIKTCPVTDIGKYYSRVITFFKYLPKAEKNECAQNFYRWAEENKNEEPLKFAYAENLLGMYHFTVEEFELALPLLAASRKCFEEYNDKEGIAASAILIGATYRTFGNFDLSLKLSWEAYWLLKESGNYPSGLAACSNNIASINLELGNYDEALSMFSVGCDECKKADDFYFMIYSLQGLGKVSMKQNKLAEAKEYFEKALELARQNKSQLGVANSLTELANLYCHENKYAEAERLNREALAIREENHFTAGAITSCINLGEIYIAQSRWEEALKVLNEGLAMAEQLKIKPKMYQIHLFLSRIYETLGDKDKSLHHYKIFHELREKVQEEDSARKLADAKLIFEAEQTKKENIIIKRQKEEIQKKNFELQETIDELTLAKVSRKAKALTLGLAIVLFLFEDPILAKALELLNSHNYFLEVSIKMIIIFSLSPINKAIENYLLKKVIKKKKQDREALILQAQ